MFNIKYSEYKSITFNGNEYSVKYAAKLVGRNENKIEVIPGKVAEFSPCPVSGKELDFINNYFSKVTSQDEKEIIEGFININNIETPENFEINVRDIEEINLKIIEIIKKLYDEEIKYNIKNGNFYIDEKQVLDLEKFKASDKNLRNKKYISNLEGWEIKCCIAGTKINSDRKLWEEFIKEIEDLYNFSGSVKCELFMKNINFHSISLKKAEELLFNFKTVLNSNFITKVLKLNKIKKEISDKITIDNIPISSLEDCEFIIKKVSLDIKEKNLKEKWKKFIGEKSNILDSDEFENKSFQYINKIKKFLYWNEKEKEVILEEIENLGINKNFLFRNDLEFEDEKIRDILIRINSILPIILELGEKSLELIEKKERLNSLKKIIEENNTSSQINNNLIDCILNKDCEKYNNYYIHIKELQEKEKLFERKEKILKNISSVAPEWEKKLKNNRKTEVLENINEIWEYKQLAQYLAKLEQSSLIDLQKIERETNNNFKLITRELIEKKAWYNLLQFIEKGENLQIKQALIGWKQSVKKIGKGTGKNAVRYKNEAKKNMLKCQKAVPVWIMPLNKVIDTLNPAKNKFDIVIVDEASQSDIRSLVLLYMGKKIIIVGDDKQVSPSDIGIEKEIINNLQERYLRDQINNYHLYDLNSSIYSLVSTTYQPLMLREHFRCVPEIIGYSNKTSYDYKIKPLRESSDSNLKPAVISFKTKGKRDDGSKTNLEEAKNIVALMMACMEQKEYEASTFGVISLLGNEQSDLILKLITKYVSISKYKKHKILCGNPSHFQGDERDVIFLSMVDSNDNEGPLRLKTQGTEDSFKKRYNVAASRAKNQMWLIHSLDKSNDLKDGDIRKEFLEYCENPRIFLNLQEKIEKDSDSPFEKSVAEYLIAQNYNLKQQWEVGAYRIDMVVSFKGKRIAIECDGEKFHSGEEKIKKDMERQLILERCGWNFIRIRGSQYFRNPEKTMKEVISLLNENGIYPEDMEKNIIEETKENDLITKIKFRASEIMKNWEDEKEEQDIGIISQSSNEQIKKIEEEKFLSEKIDEKLNTDDQKEKISNNEKIKKEEEKIFPNKILQRSLFDKSASNNEDVFNFLKTENIEYIDNTTSSGILWIIYDKLQKEKIENFLKGKNYKFSLEKRGAMATNNKPAWRIKVED